MSLLLIALLQFSLLFRNAISTCSTTSNLEFTFYGYPDGPSNTTSFGCSGTQQVTDGTAEGDGSYAHPETFATALNNPDFVPCEIIYIPLLQKYFQYMDHCEAWMNLYPTTIRLDLWIGSDVNGGQSQITCEDYFGLKTGQTIVRNPPSTLKANGGQLWDNDSGTCGYESLVFPNYSTSEADLCGDSSPAPAPAPAPAIPSPSSTPAAAAAPASTPAPAPSSSTATTPSRKEKEVAVVDKSANIKANANVDVKPPTSTTLKTIVSSSSSSSSSSSPSSSSPLSSSSSLSNEDCGVTAEWPTPWLGHCVGTPCYEFNDCSGELICQGWPNPVCTNPKGGK